jgi:hypothetical protein
MVLEVGFFVGACGWMMGIFGKESNLTIIKNIHHLHG